MRKFFACFIILILYFTCFILDNETGKDYKVLGVVDGSKIYVDLNENGKKDRNELIRIKNIVTFPIRYTEKLDEYAEKFNITNKGAINVGYLAKKFTQENLHGSYINIKDKDLEKYNPKHSYRFAKIHFKNKDYARLLLEEGLAFAYIKDREINPYLALVNKKKIIKNSNIPHEEYFIFDDEAKVLHKPECKELMGVKKFEAVKKEELKKQHRKCEMCINFIPPAISKQITDSSSFKKGRVTLYVNNPNYFKYPSNLAKTSVCRFLINEIDNAKKSVDFSIYGIDNQIEFVHALNNAYNRGVLVRGVSDSSETGDVTYPDTKKLKDKIKVTYDNSKPIMHDKFFIIDNKILTTGSMNISKTGCGGYNANSIVVIEDENIISAYKKEFEQMHNGKFKKDKTDFSTSLIDVGEGVKLSAHFSPVGDIYNKVLLPEIKKAKQEIRVSIFVLTHRELVQELIKAKNKGVKVRVIADAVGAGNYRDILTTLKENGIKVKVENWGGKNHEKTISIDDNTLIIGSANFSYSAISRNDENLIRIKDKDITAFYNNFFDTLYNSIDDIYLELYPSAEGFESGNSCYDGIDNDFDGSIDSKDTGCIKYR